MSWKQHSFIFVNVLINTSMHILSLHILVLCVRLLHVVVFASDKGQNKEEERSKRAIMLSTSIPCPQPYITEVTRRAVWHELMMWMWQNMVEEKATDRCRVGRMKEFTVAVKILCSCSQILFLFSFDLWCIDCQLVIRYYVQPSYCTRDPENL